MFASSSASPLAWLLALFALVSAAGLGLYLRRRRSLRRLANSRPAPVQAVAGDVPAAPPFPRDAEPRRPLIALRRPRATCHPILLVHGWLGFDRIGPSALEQHYFRGVPARLCALGHRVHLARVSPFGSIRVRAAQLAEQVERLGSRVNIIAHSMGGLDARLAIARHGLSERVVSLTTIGTPHHGTPLSDFASAFGEWRTLRRTLAAVGVSVDGVYDLSTVRMREFNRVVLDSPEVVYSSVVGAVNLQAGGVHALLAACHQYLLRQAGPNDGVVPATSQLWGEALDEVDADHWAQVGWSRGFDVLSFYARLAERLVDRGL
jgi:triacylglycerol lipase